MFNAIDYAFKSLLNYWLDWWNGTAFLIGIFLILDDKAENEILEKTSPKERGGANSAVSRGQNDGINKDRRKEPDRSVLS